MRLMFYNNHVFQYYSDYVSYEDRSSLWTILMNTKSNDNGSDVIMGLTAASRLDPVATCLRKRGARRIVVVVADEVDDVTSPQPATFWNMMEERGVDVLMLAVGNHSSLALLDNYLDLNGRDRIIKLDDYIPLNDGSVLGIVKEEVCKVTPEMASYRNGLSASFRVNFTYNGHTYYLSKDKGYNLTQMHQTCSSAGGYLAVMNDKQEYNYMKQYFIDNDFVYGFYLDGTDAHIEGMWTLFSGEPLPFVDWKPGQPKPYNRDRSCLLWSSISHKMFDDGCFGQNHPTYRYRFLCEVPDTCDA